jgi:hypothetical protein
MEPAPRMIANSFGHVIIQFKIRLTRFVLRIGRFSMRVNSIALTP